MVVRRGRLHHHIGSIGQFRGSQRSLFIGEHFRYLISILLSVCCRYQPCAVSVCPAFQLPLIDRCRLLTGKIIIIEFPDVRIVPGSSIFRLYLPLADCCQLRHQIDREPGPFDGLQFRLALIIRSLDDGKCFFLYMVSRIHNFISHILIVHRQCICILSGCLIS